MIITIPLDCQKLDMDDVFALMALAESAKPGQVTVELDYLNDDELEGLTKIAAAACTDPEIVIALALEIEARTNPKAGEATACDHVVIADLMPAMTEASAA